MHHGGDAVCVICDFLMKKRLTARLLIIVRTIDIFSAHPAHNPALVVYVGTRTNSYCAHRDSSRYRGKTLCVTVTY